MSMMTRTVRRRSPGRQEPEPEVGVLEPPELVAQSFGVERPAFAVPADERRALDAAERVGLHHGIPQLQVMAGNVLVVARGDIAPLREHCAVRARGTTCGPDD